MVFVDTVGNQRCSKFSLLSSNIRRAVKRKGSLTPVSRSKRAHVSSKCRLDYLTPKSRKRRLNTSQRVPGVIRKKMMKLQQLIAEHDVQFEDQQSHAMEAVVNVINDNFKQELDNVISDGTREPQKEILRNIWKRDFEKKHLQEKENFLWIEKRTKYVIVVIDGQQ